LLKTAAETLITIAADPKHLGARIGLTAVLHTWGISTDPPSARPYHRTRRRLVARPPALDGLPAPLLSLRRGALTSLFRRLFLERLTAAYQAGRLEFFAAGYGRLGF
jgi:hypothetical protein